MAKYFIAGDRLLAFNFKCATSSFCWAIIKKYYPETLDALTNKTSYPEGRSAETSMNHQFVPTRTRPDRPVAALIREPVERFRSAIVFTGVYPKHSVDELITELYEENGTVKSGPMGQMKLIDNHHFSHQHRFGLECEDITYFRMPDQINEAAEWLGLDTPLTKINSARSEKPNLTQEQIDKIQEFYKKDIVLWESIGGKSYDNTKK